MRRSLDNILRLGVKELYSLRNDYVMMFLIVYTFTLAIYTVANGVKTEVRNASVAIVDEDQSTLSRTFASALLKPYFKAPEALSIADIDASMDSGRYSFVIDMPPRFEADLLAGRNPTVQLSVDATAMTLAGNGTGYIQSIFAKELAAFLPEAAAASQSPIDLEIRSRFNPNLESSWFTAIMQIINNVTMLSMILAGAAVIREREHGTVEHLLVMPVTPVEIMLAKVWANGLVILAAVLVSLIVVVQGLIGAKVSGSYLLFAFGTALFLFAMTSLGITLATIARSMPQFGLLAIPFFVVMNMLSGGVTPLEAMPQTLQYSMQFAPSTPYTAFSQAVLMRGATLSVVWPELLSITAIGAVLLGIALFRFRDAMAATR